MQGDLSEDVGTKPEDGDFKNDVSLWSQIAEEFGRTQQIRSLQSTVTLYNMSKANEADRVLEVGCGAGLGSTVFAQSLMTKGACFFVGDMSSKMVEMTNKAILESDWRFNQKNKLVALGPANSVDVKALFEEHQDFQKTVFTYEASSEALPFSSNSFNSYIDSMSIYLTKNPKQAIGEAYRVLEKGGIAAFANLGRKDKSSWESLLFKSIKAHCGESIDYSIGDYPLTDPEEFKSVLLDAGFKSVKYYF
jgi:ubiquinone/menaquinone biosynthesis C-methylase UbiE